MIYKLCNDVEFNNIIGVFNIQGNVTTFIPFSPDNTDYQEYLEWVAEGNTPEEAE